MRSETSVAIPIGPPIECIEQRISNEPALVSVVAIDGHSAAGKSTFAARLVRQLDAALIPGDDFYRVMDPQERAELDPELGVRRYYDWERMRQDVLVPLSDRCEACYRPYDWHHNSLARHTKTIAPRSVIVVEGLFVGRPELADLVDIAVVVMSDPALRRQRQHDRDDANEEWLDRWDAAERWYFEHVRPVADFDLIVTDDL